MEGTDRPDRDSGIGIITSFQDAGRTAVGIDYGELLMAVLEKSWTAAWRL